MNWLNRIFNWKKAPRAINEMKPVEIGRIIVDYSDAELESFVYNMFWKVKKSWRRNPKNYHVWLSRDDKFKLFKLGSDTDKMLLYQGNLYTLYHQYYGKENKS